MASRNKLGLPYSKFGTGQLFRFYILTNCFDGKACPSVEVFGTCRPWNVQIPNSLQSSPSASIHTCGSWRVDGGPSRRPKSLPFPRGFGCIIHFQSMNPRNFVTIVSGMPRAGTSMMMQILESGGIPALTDRVREADEDNLEGYFEFEPVKKTKQDKSWLDNARGKVVKVIYMLLYDLPPDHVYRVVFMRRSLDEVLASQSKMLQRRGEPGATVSQEQLHKIFTDQLQKVDSWLASRDEFDVLNVNHRDVIEDAEREAKRINEFLGGALDEAAMSAAVNPSLYRQRSDS